MSNSDHTEDDNESGREAAPEVLLGEQATPDRRTYQSTHFPHGSDLTNWRESHHGEDENVGDGIKMMTRDSAVGII
jgi:hypothetical protein